jgi:AcrR family transcriptional regulator
MREITTNIKKPELVEKRREQILQAALTLFRKNGYHGTTMRQICEKSKVNRASIYDYFGSKSDILVYIYKTMMYGGGKFDEAFPEASLSGWEDIEPFIRSVLTTSWNKNKHPIQVLNRETIALDKKSMKDVLKIESDYVKWLAENFRKGLGFPTITKGLELIANTMAYLNSFSPMRSWNMRHMDQKEIIDFTVDVLMMKLEKLRPADQGPGVEKKPGNEG